MRHLDGSITASVAEVFREHQAAAAQLGRSQDRRVPVRELVKPAQIESPLKNLPS
jgi:hypothetical protein